MPLYGQSRNVIFSTSQLKKNRTGPNKQTQVVNAQMFQILSRIQQKKISAVCCSTRSQHTSGCSRKHYPGGTDHEMYGLCGQLGESDLFTWAVG